MRSNLLRSPDGVRALLEILMYVVCTLRFLRCVRGQSAITRDAFNASLMDKPLRAQVDHRALLEISCRHEPDGLDNQKKL